MGPTYASVQDCTELGSISQLRGLQNDYGNMQHVLDVFSNHVKIFHSQFHREIIILSACTLPSYDTFLESRWLFEKLHY